MNNETTVGVVKERLPAFLRVREVDGVNRTEMVLSASGASTFSQCGEKYRLGYVERVELAVPRPALVYGKAIHEALAVRYKWEKELGSGNVELGMVETMQATRIGEFFEANPQPVEDYRNAGRAMDAIRAYNAAYPRHDWTVLAVEEPFEVRVGQVQQGNSVPLPLYFRGIKDLVVKWHDGLWVVDFKTCGDWNGDLSRNRNLLEGRRSFQFRGYAWAEVVSPQGKSLQYASRVEKERANYPVLGTVGSYICSRKPYEVGYKPRANAQPRDQFHLECYPFGETVLAEWRTDCLRLAQGIYDAWSMDSFRRDTGMACGFNGRCPFYDYCEADPEERENLLSTSLYQPRENRDETFEGVVGE